MATFSFYQVDVFTTGPLKGNPLAVVAGADGLSDQQMADFANWTNLSETTFLLKPTAAEADYRVRIFTPERELPFAGHPTLGSCHVWLNTGGHPQGPDVVQECGAGLIRIRSEANRLAFAAPPLRRSGDVEPEILAKIATGLGLQPAAIKESSWADNGPGWVAVLLSSREELLALKPDYPALTGLPLGAIAPWDVRRHGRDADFEVRAFIPDRMTEDPVTGSLNAALAQWLIPAGLAPPTYIASQGTALGRAGRIYVEQTDTDIWVGGQSVTCIDGHVQI